MQAWLRMPHGLAHIVDTDPQMHGAVTTLVKDTHPKATKVASESAFQADRTSLLGSNPTLKISTASSEVTLTTANPGE